MYMVISSLIFLFLCFNKDGDIKVLEYFFMVLWVFCGGDWFNFISKVDVCCIYIKIGFSKWYYGM